jgi:hypothetical protein
MPLIRDEALVKDVGTIFGEYLGTLLSARGEARADIFDTGTDVIAHVSFPTGLSPAEVHDQYLGDLREYADHEGFADRFRLIFSQ